MAKKQVTKKTAKKAKHTTGGDTEGGITSSYATDDGVTLKVPYAFRGAVYTKAEQDAVLDAMKGDTLTMGPITADFQAKFAKKHKVKHALAVSSCTTGLHLAMQLFDLKAGDEVITTPTTFFSTSLAILKEGAIPVYADINPRTYNIDPRNIEKLITRRTKAIMVVHYGGLMCDMDPIMRIARKHKLLVCEDAAHAHNATYKGRMAGSIGDIGVFSFHSLKNMSIGEGGMITTNNDEFAQGAEELRCMNIVPWKPSQKRWTFGNVQMKKTDPVEYWIPSHFDIAQWKGRHWGNNYRMSEMQAAIGRVQLERLDEQTNIRRKIGHKITKGISGIKGIIPVFEPKGRKHVFH
ncbi:MAG: DegT/DnrJ/EryC1/StrS family aminotransferase, partial [Planctomycetes bacterium]|nr:DegT/DnrJ/EryC1/StrS family aminotransferase [Planctomycetota bacterium]